jgi:Reverse transcriptase (RNA-dependent DNA polymerase)
MQDQSFLYLLFYVDDMLIAAKDLAGILKIKKHLSDEFDMKNLGARKILGMEIHQDRQAQKLFLTQQKYMEKVLERFGMSDCKSVVTPLAGYF